MLKIIRNIRGLFVAAVLFAPLTSVQAALLDVTSLSVNYVETSITAGSLINTGVSSSIVPPAELLMGSFQDPVFTFSSTFAGGSISGRIYTTDAFGASAPQVTVDTVGADFSSVDLSSLRMSGLITLDGNPSGSYSFNTELWPLVTTPSTSKYDHATGEFSLSWAFSEMIDYTSALGPQSLQSDFSVTISGNATVVPVPAAFWLFLSGLLGLLGVIKRNK